jgi:GNAT superfamily N-acetyltransferase
VTGIVCEPGTPDDAREIQRRRRLDEATLALSLELAERGGVWVARDDAEIVAILVAHDSSEERYVGDCFVEPSYRQRGIAGGLLQAAFESVDDRARTMIADPANPASLAVALRGRLALREPVLRFAGAIPKEEELARMAAGEYRFQVESIDPAAHAFGLRALDRQTRGTTRDLDHERFARNASGHAFFLRGEFVAYAYVWPDGRIGPIACSSQNYVVQIFAYALLSLTRAYGASWCSTIVPGSNRRIGRTVLRAGLRIEETSLLAGDTPEGDLSTYVGYHRLVF